MNHVVATRLDVTPVPPAASAIPSGGNGFEFSDSPPSSPGVKDVESWEYPAPAKIRRGVDYVSAFDHVFDLPPWQSTHEVLMGTVPVLVAGPLIPVDDTVYSPVVPVVDNLLPAANSPYVLPVDVDQSTLLYTLSDIDDIDVFFDIEELSRAGSPFVLREMSPPQSPRFVPTPHSPRSMQLVQQTYDYNKLLPDTSLLHSPLEHHVHLPSLHQMRFMSADESPSPAWAMYAKAPPPPTELPPYWENGRGSSVMEPVPVSQPEEMEEVQPEEIVDDILHYRPPVEDEPLPKRATKPKGAYSNRYRCPHPSCGMVAGHRPTLVLHYQKIHDGDVDVDQIMNEMSICFTKRLAEEKKAKKILEDFLSPEERAAIRRQELRQSLANAEESLRKAAGVPFDIIKFTKAVKVAKKRLGL